MFLEDILETTLYKEQSQVQKTKKILQKFTLKKISKTRTTNLAFHCLCRPFWRRQWHPTPVLLPGKSHGWRSLVGWGPRGCQESDTTEWLHFHFSLWCVGEGNGHPLQCSCLENLRDRESGGLPSTGSHRVGYDWNDLAAAAEAAAVDPLET